MTTVRLAFGGDPRVVTPALSVAPAPALLVSYEYLEQFEKLRPPLVYRDWVLDSGAYSAFTQGKTILLGDFIATYQRLRQTDGPRLSEVFALDVIGDWRASEKNCRAMWGAGIEAIPCYHYGEPEDVLVGLARDYPKIALGGCARKPAKVKARFAEQCFARIWPKKVHGFGFGATECVLAAPFHSVDASSWSLRPCGFGSWQAYRGHVGVRNADMDLRIEVEWYLDLERRARVKWRREMAQLEQLGGAS